MSAIVMAYARERELGGMPSERRRAALDLARGLIRRRIHPVGATGGAPG
jgi:hypothetical protein